MLHNSLSNHAPQHFSARLTLTSAKTTRQPTADKTNPLSRHEQPQHNRTIACNHAIQPSTNHSHTGTASNIDHPSITNHNHSEDAQTIQGLNTGWQTVLSFHPASSLPVFRPLVFHKIVTSTAVIHDTQTTQTSLQCGECRQRCEHLWWQRGNLIVAKPPETR